MTRLQEVRVGVQPLERFGELLGDEELAGAMASAAALRERLARRVVWNVNSTAVGGGVAEMLQSLLTYARAAGIDTRWIVIEGNPDFFKLTKRLHHALHGSRGDGSELGDEARKVYEESLRGNAVELATLLQPGDVVILHDPQTAGMAPHLRGMGVHVVWRCHIGNDTANEEVQRGWAFLAPYLDEIPFFIFSREAYVPDFCDHGKSTVIRPSIDAFSPKNQAMSEAAVRTILVHTGLVEGPPPEASDHTFLREDGTPGRVERRADVVRRGRAPKWETPLIVQVSRWDPLKDPVGVMKGFEKLLESGHHGGVELVLAGPNVHGVTDDLEAAATLDEVQRVWSELPPGVRDRIHLASLPVTDVQENAAIVNALQRHATIVVQKSLQEGFGLTVTEAMWKRRPVVASAVGGIQDQIQDGETGLLLKDPSDLEGFARCLERLLDDPEFAEQLAEAGRDHVRKHFLGVRHLLQYAVMIEEFDRDANGTDRPTAG